MEEEYYLQHPRNQKFYINLSRVMSFISVGDRRLLGYDRPPKFSFINSKIMLIFGPMCVVSQLIYFFVYHSELTFDTLGILFSIFPATCLANVNIITSKFKIFKRLLKMLFTEIHLYTVYNKNTEDLFVKKKLFEVERYTRLTTWYLSIMFIFTWIGWISVTAVNNIKNKELILNKTARLQTCVFLYMPMLDYSYDFQNWYVVHAINVHTVGTGVTAMAVFQSLNNIFVYNIIGHIQILKNFMKTDFEGDLSDEEVKKRLVKIIKYHAFITRVFKDVEQAFGFNVIANYAQNLLGNSIVLYQLMYGGKENMILYIMMIMAYTGAPIVLSVVLEEVKRQTDDLPLVVYDMPWENMSVPNQKIFILILQRMQIVFEFQALGLMTAGVKPMVSILKTTFSYYVMLETTMSVKS